jgi:hypothetical protein
MPSKNDVLLELIDEQWAQARQSENTRASMTNFILIITSVAIGFLFQKGPVKDALPISIFLILLGLYGALVSAKIYERFRQSVDRGWEWVKLLDKSFPNAKI